MTGVTYQNPYKPGAGHAPPYLAGRDHERTGFLELLRQTTILDNLVLTGLRGVGKTVLLNTFRPLAMEKGWLWVQGSVSESAMVSETRLAERILLDLSVVTSSIVKFSVQKHQFGFDQSQPEEQYRSLGFSEIHSMYENTPGLVADKLRHVLETVWTWLEERGARGVIFAYDEAQNLEDERSKHEYPLSVLLDVFQSLQQKKVPMMLVLSGLPTLFPKMVNARTYAERMFQVVTLDNLTESEGRQAILRPLDDNPVQQQFIEPLVHDIVTWSSCYPYFIQFICRETYDIFLQPSQATMGIDIPISEIIRKLDDNFFAGRWNRITDRQRQLLSLIALLPNCDEEFTVAEVVEQSKQVGDTFSSSHVNQMLGTLSNHGLVYKNRHGKYALAVPLLAAFIRRQS